MNNENIVVSEIRIDHEVSNSFNLSFTVFFQSNTTVRIIFNFIRDEHFLFWKISIFPMLEYNPNIESIGSHKVSLLISLHRSNIFRDLILY